MPNPLIETVREAVERLRVMAENDLDRYRGAVDALADAEDALGALARIEALLTAYEEAAGLAEHLQDGDVRDTRSVGDGTQGEATFAACSDSGTPLRVRGVSAFGGVPYPLRERVSHLEGGEFRPEAGECSEFGLQVLALGVLGACLPDADLQFQEFALAEKLLCAHAGNIVTRTSDVKA